MSTEWIFAGLFVLVGVGGIWGWLWIRRHPDVE
jgi:hypothetical protein